MMFVGILALCIVSAVLGRLLLTRDQALKTITVRLPALVMLLLTVVFAIAFWLLWGIICFIGGSFYGLGQWWWPQLFAVLEFNGEILVPIISGSWDN